PDTSRYVYPEVVLLLLVLAEALRGARLTHRRAALAAAVAIPLILVGDLVQLGNVGGALRARSVLMRAELGAYERSEVPAGRGAAARGAVLPALWRPGYRLPTF